MIDISALPLRGGVFSQYLLLKLEGLVSKNKRKIWEIVDTCYNYIEMSTLKSKNCFTVTLSLLLKEITFDKCKMVLKFWMSQKKKYHRKKKISGFIYSGQAIERDSGKLCILVSHDFFSVLKNHQGP